MKKIVSFLLATLTLLSIFVTTALAAEEATPTVMTELSQLYINGKKFDQAEYPKNTSRGDLQILAVAEVGFKSQTSSSGYGLYIYVYNPSCYSFEDSDSNIVQMGLNFESNSYVYYGLKIMSKSSDNRFIKFKVVSYGQNAASELYKLQANAAERVYNIPLLRLKKNGQIVVYSVSKVYLFSGFDFNKTLSCSVRDLDVIEVELHATSWVSPNAGGTVSGREADKFDHYEIHSVYFAVDKSYLQNYGFISSIRANYTSAKLTPIVVTRPNVFDELTKNMIVNAVPITGQDVMDLVANRQSGSYSPPDKDYIMGVPYADWLYTEKQNIISEFNGLYSTPVYNRLAYYFENDQIPENFDMGDASYIVGFTSEELEAYFDFQINKGIDLGALCYDMQLNQNIDYTSKDMFDLKTYETNLTGIAKWWFNYFIDDDSYLKENFVTEIKKIQVIDNPSVYSNIPSSHKESVSKDLCINVCDLDAFSKFCKDEVTSDQVVVILRYGIADYRCTGIIDVWEVDGELGNKIVGYSIEKSAFMDVSVAQVAFTSECVTTVIPTASNVVDSYGDGLVFDVVGDLSVDLGDIGDGLSGWLADLFNQLFEKLKVALFIIACIVLIPVFFPIVRGVFRLVTKRKRKNKS